MAFIKNVENFVCENCDSKVNGDGYTNHCPHCLWSKHVDVDPGDRAAHCGGLMEPVGTEEREGEWRVVQKCLKCGKIHKNRLSTTDNFDKLVNLAKSNALK